MKIILFGLIIDQVLFVIDIIDVVAPILFLRFIIRFAAFFHLELLGISADRDAPVIVVGEFFLHLRRKEERNEIPGLFGALRKCRDTCRQSSFRCHAGAGRGRPAEEARRTLTQIVKVRKLR